MLFREFTNYNILYKICHIFCQNCRVFLFLFVCFFKSIIEKSAWKVRLVLPIKRSELWFSLTSQYKNFESRHVHFFSFSRINVEFVCKLNPISDKDLFKKIDREVPRNYRARLINQASPPKRLLSFRYYGIPFCLHFVFKCQLYLNCKIHGSNMHKDKQ